MPPTPIYSAMFILRNAIFDALDPLTPSGVYWLQAKQGEPLPFVVYQSQDLGGRAEKRIGSLAWSGLVTVRALAASQSAAEALMTAVIPGMGSLSASGYSITTNYERPVVIPVSNGIWQTGHTFRVHISAA